MIFLKVNRFKCIASLFKRKRLRKRFKIDTADLAEGCFDKLDFSFLKWAFTFNNDYAPKLLEVINKYPNVDLKIFSTREDAVEFINNL